MRRRQIITLLGGAAAAWPSLAQAQTATVPMVGFLDPRSPDAISERLRGFRHGLKETGYIEGENVAIVYRFAENQADRLPEMAADLVRRQVAVIATAGEQVAVVAKAATTTVPIIFIASQDPVKLGFVASLSRPGGNMTTPNEGKNEQDHLQSESHRRWPAGPWGGPDRYEREERSRSRPPPGDSRGRSTKRLGLRRTLLLHLSFRLLAARAVEHEQFWEPCHVSDRLDELHGLVAIGAQGRSGSVGQHCESLTMASAGT
jgi:hypothetical protein